MLSVGYPPVGGTRQRYFAGTNFKPRKLPACTLPQAQVKTRRVLPVRCIIRVHFRDALLAANECIRQFACLKESSFLRLSGNALPELLGEPDEKSFGATDVAEPIRVLVLNHFADESRAVLA